MNRNYKFSSRDDLHLTWSASSLLSRGYNFYYYDNDYCEESDSDVYVEVLSTILEEDEDNLSTTTRGSGLARGSEDIARNIPLLSISSIKGSSSTLSQDSANFAGKLDLKGSESSILARASKSGGLLAKTNIIPELPPLEEMLRDVIGKHPRLLSQSGSLTDIPDDSSDNTWEDSSGDDCEIKTLFERPMDYTDAGADGTSIDFSKDFGAGGDGVDVGHIESPIVDCNNEAKKVKEVLSETEVSNKSDESKLTVEEKPTVLQKELTRVVGKIKPPTTNDKATPETAVKSTDTKPKATTPKLAHLSDKVRSKRETSHVNEHKISQPNEKVHPIKRETPHASKQTHSRTQEKVSSQISEQKSHPHEKIRTKKETSQASEPKSSHTQQKVGNKKETSHASDQRTSPIQEKTRIKKDTTQVSEQRNSHLQEKNRTKRETSRGSEHRTHNSQEKVRTKKETSHANESRSSYAQEKVRSQREKSSIREQKMHSHEKIRTTTKETSLVVEPKPPIPKRKVESKRIVESYKCTHCSLEFSLKSLLNAHLLRHEATRSHKKLGGAEHSYSTGSGHECTYCNRVFALSQVLHVHLLQYCEQIPLAQRRKMLKFDHDHSVSSSAHPRGRSNARANPPMAT